MSSIQETAGSLAAAADSCDKAAALIHTADEMRSALGFLSAAGEPALNAWGGPISMLIEQIDEIAARLMEIHDQLEAAASRVAQGGPVSP